MAAVAVLLGVAACGEPTAPAEESATPGVADPATYVSPPAVTTARPEGGALRLEGTAPSAAVVRLAAPGGVALSVTAGKDGRWALTLPAASAAQIWGLSMTVDGRRVQAQGYLLTTPKGQAAMRRAGAGAIRLDPQPAGAIGAVDFDRDGGAVVSGRAPAGAVVLIRLDGRGAAEGRADATGRFEISFDHPGVGSHRLQLFGDGFQDATVVATAAAQPLAGRPLRSQLTSGGLRCDWTTPGGGLQSTVIVD
ncbi:MAG: hypothetical protein ABW360_07490 [Phenylobacterium sp.]